MGVDIMDRLELFSKFVSGIAIHLDGFTGHISSIQREDGSGFRFNLTIHGRGTDEGKTRVIYMECKGK